MKFIDDISLHVKFFFIAEKSMYDNAAMYV